MMRSLDSQIKSIERTKKMYQKKKVKFMQYLKVLKSRVTYLEDCLERTGASFDSEGKIVEKSPSLTRRKAEDATPSTGREERAGRSSDDTEDINISQVFQKEMSEGSVGEAERGRGGWDSPGKPYSWDGYLKTYAKSVTAVEGETHRYGLASWLAPDNPLNQEMFYVRQRGESLTCRIELDVNAVISALATAKHLAASRVLVHTESKYLPRITLDWLRLNKLQDWHKVKTIFKSSMCLDRLLELVSDFEDVKIVQVDKTDSVMNQIARSLYTKVGFLDCK